MRKIYIAFALAVAWIVLPTFVPEIDRNILRQIALAASTYYVSSAAAGGGAGSLVSPWTLQEAADNAGVAGDEVRVLNDGTYTPSARIDFDTKVGTVATWISFRGRKSDDSVYEMATISGASLGAGADLIYFGSAGVAQYLRFTNLRFTAGKDDNIDSANKDNAYVQFENCRIDSAADEGAIVCNQWKFIQCEIDSNVGNGLQGIASGGAGGMKLLGCALHDNVYGLSINSSYLAVIGNLFYDNTADGFSAENISYSVVIGNTFDRNDSDAFAPFGNIANNIVVIGNIFTNSGAYGINGYDAYQNTHFFGWNCYYGNASGETDYAAGTPGTGNVSADPLFVSTTDGSENYHLQPSSPCRGAGMVGVIANGLATGYADIGALQHANPIITYPTAPHIYAGEVVTSDGTTLVTGTLNASNISAAAGAGSDLSAGILKKDEVVDDVTGSYEGAGGGGEHSHVWVK